MYSLIASMSLLLSSVAGLRFVVSMFVPLSLDIPISFPYRFSNLSRSRDLSEWPNGHVESCVFVP